MTKEYEVTIHTHVGRLYRVSAETPQEAENAMIHRYADLGENGDEIVYEETDRIEVTEITAAMSGKDN